eukprot:CAMPEP_0201124750 /NCGR_PEP_ID=MMETSP0850-20130426/17004_1 /ASSEMBLY_ACC=CAM_ASM_000622 /TAXON_ID=183588 /ORGANISM="Pseudo-nitzschia fraudulenta, Strain WWA7" /LENGTH=309 /DNA_ID=CAMNT_0047392355 /DNA_START=60 /DNA_END=989 /DNA_ORIENTATION=-
MKVVYFAFCLSLVLGNVQRAFGFSQTALNRGKQTSSNGSRLQQTTEDHGIVDENSAQLSRRAFAGSAAAMAVLAGMAPSAGAAPTIATAADGSLPDLPNEAVRSYLQYRIPLQIAADYYVFALQDMIGDIDQWGDVGQLFRVNNNKGQGQPSKIERDFVNPMRVMLLSFPPDVAEDMRDAQFRFEKAANKISKATAGYRRDLPVEVDKSSITNAKDGWDEGRIALNEFFVLLNTAVGLNELTPIPAAGPNQTKEYGRSARRYNDLQKKIKLCQNRGGPALSQAWGQLMVSGYLQDSCGIPDMSEYFQQK